MRTYLLLVLVAVGLSACNTIHGAGQDLSSAGHAVSTAATDTQNKL